MSRAKQIAPIKAVPERLDGPSMRESAAYDPGQVVTSEIDYWTTAQIFSQAKALAYACVPIDEIASQIAYDAMLGAQVCRNKQQHHRRSWLKHQRYKKYGPTKALLHKNQLVQNYVYREAEKYEKYHEGDEHQPINNRHFEYLLEHCPLNEPLLIFRYLKYLIGLSDNNSVNAVLAVTKLIYKYRTIDAAEIYTQLHSDGPADNYFSKRRGEFTKRLMERFRVLIDRGVMVVCQGGKREKYFQGQQQTNSRWAQLVADYFKFFTPWGTTCLHEGSGQSFISNLWHWLTETFSEDQRRLNRIHTLLCPDCFGRLMRELLLAEPAERLALPDFFLPQQGELNMIEQQPIEIEKREVKTVLRSLNHEALRRKRAEINGVNNISIQVDDQELKRLDPNTANGLQFSITTGLASRLLKVYTEDQEGRLLLATILLDQDELSSTLPDWLADHDYLILDGQQKLIFTITNGNDGQYSLAINYRDSFTNRTTLFWHQYCTIMQSVWLK